VHQRTGLFVPLRSDQDDPTYGERFREFLRLIDSYIPDAVLAIQLLDERLVVGVNADIPRGKVTAPLEGADQRLAVSAMIGSGPAGLRNGDWLFAPGVADHAMRPGLGVTVACDPYRGVFLDHVCPLSKCGRVAKPRG
jgi:hypothetical protein